MKLKKFVQEQGGQTRDYHQIDPRLLQVRPDFNIRDLTTPAARERLDVLKAQVKAEGILEPLEIEFDGETPWINEGHRRHIVVMELIGEGHDFKTVPCVQERQNIKDDKRTLHMLMRGKEEYEPLEYAKGVDRLVNVYGWDKGDLAASLGFKSKASIENYLGMLAMPDEVQNQVRDGAVSATAANNLLKRLPAGTDPVFAAQLIKEEAEEKRKLTGKSRATPKALNRAVERHKPKPPAKQEPPRPAPDTETTVLPPAATISSGLPATQESSATFTPLSDETPPVEQPRPMSAVLSEIAMGTSSGERLTLAPNITIAKSPTLTPAEALLWDFMNAADADALASIHANLKREQEEAAASGSDTVEQWHLTKAADHIGHLRFPDQWEPAKGNSELAQVA